MSNAWDQPDTLVERVMAGVKYMDENHEDWRGRVDITRFNIGRPSYCIIGQAVGDYYTWRDSNGFDCGEAIDMGFELDMFEEWTYEQLNDVWLHVLAGDKL